MNTEYGYWQTNASGHRSNDNRQLHALRKRKTANLHKTKKKRKPTTAGLDVTSIAAQALRQLMLQQLQQLTAQQPAAPLGAAPGAAAPPQY